LAEARPADEGCAAGLLRTRVLQHGADDVHAADRHPILGKPTAGRPSASSWPTSICAAICLLLARNKVRNAPPLFEATLAELDKDREMLRR
jgi:hypothetical protein